MEACSHYSSAESKPMNQTLMNRLITTAVNQSFELLREYTQEFRNFGPDTTVGANWTYRCKVVKLVYNTSAVELSNTVRYIRQFPFVGREFVRNTWLTQLRVKC